MGSDYPDQQTHNAALGRYVRWPSKHTKPKIRFAISSKIREPDYVLL